MDLAVLSANRVKTKPRKKSLRLKAIEFLSMPDPFRHGLFRPLKEVRESLCLYQRFLMEPGYFLKRLAIIGGGYIGLEYASMYTDFGAEVTVYKLKIINPA